MSRIVLKLGGTVVLDPLQVAVVAQELRTLVELGHEVALVHGGGPQLDAALAMLGDVRKVNGLRVTSSAAAAIVQDTMDAIGADLTRALASAGVPACHVGSSRKAFAATIKDAPLGRVGHVIAYHAEGPNAPADVPGTPEVGHGASDPVTAPIGATIGTPSIPVVNRLSIPVVTPVGWDADGPLNINADEGASAVAMAWGADWLVLGTDVTVVRGAAGEPRHWLDGPTALQLIRDGAAAGGMIPKLRNAVAALEGGVAGVCIGRLQPGFARRLLSGQAEGTLVRQRPLAAQSLAGSA